MTAGIAGEWDVVHRVVFPEDHDPTALPLYVDWGLPVPSLPHESRSSPLPLTPEPELTSMARHSAVLPTHSRASFATYFNAFPAGYWREWTDASRVRLDIEIEGEATIDVFRSTIRGDYHRLAWHRACSSSWQIEIPLAEFVGGSWIWFDLVTETEAARLVHAEWSVPPAAEKKKMSISITTFDRPRDCIATAGAIAQAPELLERLDALIIVDQGTRRLRNESAFAGVAARLSERLLLIEQANLGGSGGFSRGMYEASRRPATDYVLLLDDDVVVEPEGLLRAAAFADHARHPAIVGGHMFNLYQRATLHSFGERVEPVSFRWGPVDPELQQIDFSRMPLRSNPGLHRVMHVDYNGWWMCLIPKRIIDEIGLALPMFIKWDDCEFCLRAAAHGYRTISLPGAAVWHMPWIDKDDGLDWQAYFHERNNLVAALLHSKQPRGGGLTRFSQLVDIKHLVSMQYSAVALRLMALGDVLSGPAHLEAAAGERLAAVRALRQRFDDARVLTDMDALPDAPSSPPGPAPRSYSAYLLRAAVSVLRQWTPPRPQSRQSAEVSLAAFEARWWRLGMVDSALVTAADTGGVSFYRRDRKQFVHLLRESLRMHRRIRREWSRLAEEYRGAARHLASPKRWQSVFGAGEPEINPSEAPSPPPARRAA